MLTMTSTPVPWRRFAAVLIAVALAVLMAPASAVVAQEPDVPFVAYIPVSADRLVVADPAEMVSREYPVVPQQYGGFTWSADGTELLVVDAGNQVTIIDVFSGQLSTIAVGIVSAAWAPDGTVLAVTGGGGLIRLDRAGGIVERIFADGPYPFASGDPSARIYAVATNGDASFVEIAVDNEDFFEFSDIFRFGQWEGPTTDLYQFDATFAAFNATAEIGARAFFNHIDSVNLATGHVTRLRDSGSGITGGGWLSDDGASLAFAASGQVRTIPTDGRCCEEPHINTGDAPLYDMDGTFEWLLAGHPRPAGNELLVYSVESDTSWYLPDPGLASPYTPATFSPVRPTPPQATPPAPEDDPVGVTRLAGPSRVQTAVAASQDLWGPAGADHAVVVRADDFADALAATPLAAHTSGPLLLSGAAELHPDAAGELQRAVRPGAVVYVVGGTAVLSDQVDRDIRALGFDPARLAGTNRFETAQVIADTVVGALPDQVPDTVWLVGGGTFGDGLVAGNVAARTGGIVLLGNDGARFSRQTYPDTPIVQLGDFDAGPTDQRIDSTSVYALSVEVVRQRPPANGYALASGVDFPDGLAGGAHAASLNRGLLLTEPDALPSTVEDFLVGQNISTLFVYGGHSAVHPAVTNAAIR